VSLNPDYVESMSWWENESFVEKVNLKAAEMIAFEILNPALRSRAGDDGAGARLLSNKEFRKSMEILFKGLPTGTAQFPSLSEAISRISKLEDQLQKLESQIEKLKDSKHES
jgi:hypothetical protein